jgi:hypothetical protein
VFTFLQQIFPFAFAVAWCGGFAVLGIRLIAKHIQYMRTFQGVEWFVGDPVFIPASFRDYRTTWRLMLQRQSDPAIEHLRHEFWRRFLYF